MTQTGYGLLQHGDLNYYSIELGDISSAARRGCVPFVYSSQWAPALANAIERATPPPFGIKGLAEIRYATPVELAMALASAASDLSALGDFYRKYGPLGQTILDGRHVEADGVHVHGDELPWALGHAFNAAIVVNIIRARRRGRTSQLNRLLASISALPSSDDVPEPLAWIHERRRHRSSHHLIQAILHGQPQIGCHMADGRLRHEVRALVEMVYEGLRQLAAGGPFRMCAAGCGWPLRPDREGHQFHRQCRRRIETRKYRAARPRDKRAH